MKDLKKYIISESIFDINGTPNEFIYDIKSIIKDINNAPSEYTPYWVWPENQKEFPRREFLSGKVIKLDISNIEQTNYIVSLNNALSGAYRLETFDAHNMDFSNLESMCKMFFDCGRLKDVNISNWKTGKINNISSIFEQNNKLRRVDLSMLQFAPKLNITDAFRKCYSLEHIDLGPNSNCSAGFGVNGIPPSTFKRCQNLKYIRLGSLRMAYKDTSLRDCEKLEVFDGIFISSREQCVWNLPPSLRSIRIKIKAKSSVNLYDFRHLVNLDKKSIQYLIDNIPNNSGGSISVPSQWNLTNDQKKQIENKNWRVFEE